MVETSVGLRPPSAGPDAVHDRLGLEHLELLEQVARTSARLTGTDGLAIFACGDDGGQTARVIIACDAASGMLGGTLTAEMTLTRRALTSARTCVRGRGEAPSDLDGLCAQACAPIVIDGHVWGAITVGDADPAGEPGPELVGGLGDLAALATAAVQSATDRRRQREMLDSGVAALAGLLDLRDGYTGEHAEEVVGLCLRLGQRLALPGPRLDDLAIAARLHDLGKIGVPDQILHKPGPLDDQEWQTMRQHPGWGEQALRGMPGFEGIARAVRSHHERWDGTGYPDGLAGEQIPFEARIIAAADSFHAITSDRPYRRALTTDRALALLQHAAGSQLDPVVVRALLEEHDHLPAAPGPPRLRITQAAALAQEARRAPPRQTDPTRPLSRALSRVQRLPALSEPRDRMLELLADDQASVGELIGLVESDLALTVAVLGLAGATGGDDVDGVPAALRAVSRQDLHRAIGGIATVDFFQRVAGWTSPPEHLRLHAIATHRAVDRICQAVGHPRRDTLLAAALLHDVGKLVLQDAFPGYPDELLGAARTPEARVQAERAATGVDHATIGGVLLRRWSVPEPIVTAVEHHHDDDAEGLAAVIRLADLLSHYSHANPIDPHTLLTASRSAGLDAPQLRALMYELTLADTGTVRAAEPSPLTAREQSILRALATGKVYKEIGTELGLSTSTVRTHCGNIFRKLDVGDRANAVLLAAQRGWI
jgi:putative nucleotidyltransferase with HDIG domain